PLQATLDVKPPQSSEPPHQVVQWRGALAPNAQVTLTFKVRVLALCEPGQQTMTFENIAQARPRNGTEISDRASFTAKCIDYHESNIDAEWEPLDNPIDLSDLQDVQLHLRLRNNHPFTVTLGLINQQSSNLPQTAAIAGSSLNRLTLGPGESRQVDITL